jgi:hypothetical protein
MTIHAFPTPALLPTVEAARDLVAERARAPLAGWTDAEVAEGISGLVALESQVEAWRLALAAEADARALAGQEAATGTDAWLATLTGSTREVAAGGLWIARLLKEKSAATREAFAAGRLRLDQVRVIVRAAEQIPAWATAAEVRQAEEWLVARGTARARATAARWTRDDFVRRPAGCASRSPARWPWSTSRRCSAGSSGGRRPRRG